MHRDKAVNHFAVYKEVVINSYQHKRSETLMKMQSNMNPPWGFGAFTPLQDLQRLNKEDHDQWARTC